ncbi:MAG: Clp protease N-terminal domain-containing protein [Jiangellaceae bacterium]
MFERFTGDARSTVVEAQVAARQAKATQVRPVHLLLGVVAVPGGAGSRTLAELGVDLARLGSEIAARAEHNDELGGLTAADVDALSDLSVDASELIERLVVPAGGVTPGRFRRGWRRARSPGEGHLRFTAGAKSALEQALRDALRLRHSEIGSEHILLGAVAVDPEVREVLAAHGATHEALVAHVARSTESLLDRPASRST